MVAEQAPKPIEKLDVLIHPFYDPIKAGEIDELKKYPAEISKRIVDFYAKGEFKQEQEKLNRAKLKRWKKRILDIARNKKHYLAINAIEELPSKYLDKLVEFAQKKMGKDRVVLHFQKLEELGSDVYLRLAEQLSTKGYDPRKLKVNYYGEYGGGCVIHGVSELSPHIVSPSRIAQAIKVSLPLSTLFDQSFFNKRLLKGSMKEDYISAKNNVKEQKRILRGETPEEVEMERMFQWLNQLRNRRSNR